MQVHVLAELVLAPQFPASIVPTIIYGKLHPGSSSMLICLRNLGAHPTMIPEKVIVESLAPANQVPPMIPQWQLQGSLLMTPGRGRLDVQVCEIGLRKSTARLGRYC